ncbi:MAG: sensor histidine kinase [Niabella sp.]|nr:MAG: sensor histidine kinase [Niabella sp.]
MHIIKSNIGGMILFIACFGFQFSFCRPVYNKNQKNSSEVITSNYFQQPFLKNTGSLIDPKEIDQQYRIQLLGGIVLILLIAIIIFGFFVYLTRAKREKLLAQKNVEHELLLKEIHHRIKNNLEVVSSLLALQSAQTKDPNIRQAMLESQNRVRSIGIVHQKLYNGKITGTIDMRDYFFSLCENIIDSFGADDRMKVELNMGKLELDIDTAVPLGLIVNELITNTLKYAFPPGQIGHVRINLEKQHENILHLEVTDDGIGKSGHTNGTGFGTELLKLLTEQLNGKMHEEEYNGTRIVFDFKLNKVI